MTVTEAQLNEVDSALFYNKLVTLPDFWDFMIGEDDNGVRHHIERWDAKDVTLPLKNIQYIKRVYKYGKNYDKEKRTC